MVTARRFIRQSTEEKYSIDQKRKRYTIFSVLVRYYDTKYNIFLTGFMW